MSVMTPLIEGLGLVLIIVSIWLHYYAGIIAKKYNRAADRLLQISDNVDGLTAMAAQEIANIKEGVNMQLQTSIAEHIFHAMFNTLVTLGASDMGKAEKAKQTIALNGFQKIGHSIGRGLKKEIPIIEQAGNFKGGGSTGSQAGGLPGGLVESIVGDMFGVDLPPGTIQTLMNSSKPQGGPVQNLKKNEETGGWG